MYTYDEGKNPQKTEMFTTKQKHKNRTTKILLTQTAATKNFSSTAIWCCLEVCSHEEVFLPYLRCIPSGFWIATSSSLLRHPEFSHQHCRGRSILSSICHQFLLPWRHVDRIQMVYFWNCEQKHSPNDATFRSNLCSLHVQNNQMLVPACSQVVEWKEEMTQNVQRNDSKVSLQSQKYSQKYN